MQTVQGCIVNITYQAEQWRFINMSTFTLAEYIWMDGAVPTRHLRSKARAVDVGSSPTIEDFPEWSFDGSSTNQATGTDSDCIVLRIKNRSCYSKE